MATFRIGEPAPPDKPATAARLDGWKVIAAFLGKAERTVKRWESDRGLPIHREPGGAKASVYAYAGELDQWLKSSAAIASDPVPSAVASSPDQAAMTQLLAVDENPVLVQFPTPGAS